MLLEPSHSENLLPLLERFDHAWRHQGTADLEAYLPPRGDPTRRTALLDLIQIDLEYRWKHQSGRLVEEYLTRYPELAGRPEAVVELLAWEYRVRLRVEPHLSLTEYHRRFPPLRDQLAAKIAEWDTAQSRAEACPQGKAVEVPGYELGEVLGAGGMGVVYRARDLRLQREVALKFLRPERESAQFRQRFQVEARISGRLEHPGIPAVHELGELANGQPYLAMKLVRGRTLQAILRERENSPAERGRLLAIFEQVCQTVGYAHAQGVIHRDLKPSNVMVGAFGEVQVMDWGLAKELNAAEAETAGREKEEQSTELTQAGDVLGTPAYMAPEQARGAGERVDARSDVYALGAILHEILTGEMLYHGTTGRDGKAALEPCGAEEELVALVRRCVSAAPEERPAHAGEVAEVVAAFRANAEERARRAEMERTAALVREGETRKRRRLWITLAVALLLGVMGTTGGLIEARRSAQAESEARELAQGRLKQHERGIEDIADILNNLSPNEQQGQPPLYEQLRQRAEKLADRLSAEDVQDRLALARMQMILGNVLRELGSRTRSVEMLEAAWTRRHSELGPKHPDTLASLNSLGLACQKANDLPRALRLLTEALEQKREVLGPENDETLKTANNLALAYEQNGQLREAIALFEQTRKTLEQTRGPDHWLTLQVSCNLAAAYAANSQLSQAIQVYEQVRQSQEKNPTTDRFSYLGTLNNLGDAYLAVGKTSTAVGLFRQVFEERKAKLGNRHPATLTAQQNLGNALRSQQKMKEAIAFLEEAYQLQRLTLGSDHPSTLTSAVNLGTTLQAQGETRRAIDLYEEVLTNAKQQDDHPLLLTTKNNLAMALEKAGNPARAIALLVSVWETQKRTLGAGHHSTLTTANNLGQSYVKNREFARAVQLFEEIRPLAEKTQGQGHPLTLLIVYNLGMSYHVNRRVVEGLAAFEAASRGVEALGFQHEKAATILPATVDAYELAGKPGEAEVWRRKWLRVIKERYGAESVEHAQELDDLGRNLLWQKKWREAEEMLRACVKILRKKLPDLWAVADTQSLLGKALLEQKRYGEAEPILLESYDQLRTAAANKPHPRFGVPDRNRLVAAVDRLIALYRAMSREEEVKKWESERAKYPAATKK